tara:strand:+ start:2977 stop:3210 length:234 start_codon:yes stop_codon:yes gene_type:complete
LDLDTEFCERERLSSYRPRDEWAAGILTDALHLVREDAERHAELDRGSRHRVATSDDEEPFGALRRILTDEDSAEQG